MAKTIFLLGLAVLMALANAQYQGGFMASPLSENSFQNNEVCISYLNTSLAESMVKLNRPGNANNAGFNAIGKEVEEIINKKITNLMLKCRGINLTTPPEIANHFNMDGKSFLVEQLAIQKTEIKPRLKAEVDNIIQIDKLKASLNKIAKEKAEQEQLGSQKLSLAASKRAEIEKLKERLEEMIQSRNHEYQSGNFYYNRFNQRSLELQEERKKYASLKEKYDEILTNVCGCTRCRNNQTPNNWANILSTGRNVEKETNTSEVLWKTTTVNTPTIH